MASGCTAFRILRYREPTLETVRRFPHRSIPPSTAPWVLPEARRDLGTEFHVTYPDKWKGNARVGSGATLATALADAPVTALVVLHDGRLVYEYYAGGGGPGVAQPLFSVSKPIVAALVGIAISEGKMTGLDQPVRELVPSLRRRAFPSLTVRHLLEMTSGVGCDEDPRHPLGGVNALFYTRDIPSRVRGWKAVSAPGARFDYRSADTQILGLALHAATGVPLTDYLATRIWEPAGMESAATFSLDRKNGTEKAFCCLSATARDLARFGQLYLDGGRRGDLPVVPASWVVDSTRSHPDGNPSFGWHWWLMEHGDSFYMDGILGQYLYVNRARRVVVAMLSTDYSRIDEEVFADLARFVSEARSTAP